MSAPIEWPPTTERPEPTNNATEVWRAELAVDPATFHRLENMLADDERERAARFIFQQDRDRFIAARGILRDVLSRYLQCEPRNIGFAYGPPASLLFPVVSRGIPSVSIFRTRMDSR